MLLRRVFQAWCVLLVALAVVSPACTSTPSTPSASGTPTTSTTTPSSGPSTPSTGSATTVTVSGTAPAVGGSAQFTATAAFPDSSSRSVTADATWQSSNPAVATVTAGMVTGKTAGEADITATYQNATGKLHVTVAPATANAVGLSGPIPGIGVTTQFTAIAAFSDNTTKEVTNVAIWQSSNTSVATVNSGQVRGIANGETDISATYQNVTGTVHIRIGASGGTATSSPAPTATLVTVMGPAPAIGATSRLFAFATFSDGSSQDVTSQATWRSSNTSVAAANGGGAVTGISAGQVDISATYQNVTGTMRIAIGSTCVFSVAPGSITMPAAGGTTTLLLYASTGTCTWTATSNAAFVTITNGTSGSGGASLSISVAPNVAGARSAVLTIAGFQVTVSQAGAQAAPTCAPTLVPTSADQSAELRQGTVTVLASPGCEWSASSTSPFIDFRNLLSSGTGNGSFSYRLFGNLTGAPRSASIQVGQQTFSVNQRAALGGNALSFVSDVGDYVGQGWTLLHEAPTASFSPALDAQRNSVSFEIIGSDGVRTMYWNLGLAAPQGRQLAPGTYLNAARYPFQPATVPGLSFYGNGAGCDGITGQFTITDFAAGADGSLQRLTATFEQHCEGAAPALRGKIVYVH